MKHQNKRRFYVSEIIELPLQDNEVRCLDVEEAREVLALYPEFTESQGCYVFGIRAGQGCKPIYVGRTTKQSLGAESLTDHKVRKINEALQKTRKGTLVVAFVVPEQKRGTCPKKLIEEIEYVLIQYAYQKNRQIENENGIYRCSWFIEGVMNHGQGRLTAESREFRQLIGITNHKEVKPTAALKKRQKKARTKQ